MNYSKTAILFWPKLNLNAQLPSLPPKSKSILTQEPVIRLWDALTNDWANWTQPNKNSKFQPKSNLIMPTAFTSWEYFRKATKSGLMLLTLLKNIWYLNQTILKDAPSKIELDTARVNNKE